VSDATSGGYFASGPCAFCQLVFTFNPERVPSIPANAYAAAEIIAEGGETPPLGPKVPICADCLAKINALRMQHDLAPITPLPGAYDVGEGFPP